MTQLRTGLRWGLGLLVAVGQLGMPGAASGQGLSDVPAQMVAPAPEPQTFGTASQIAHTIQAFAFRPVSDTASYIAEGSNGGLACMGGSCAFLAPVFLPAGALVTSIELDLFDTDAREDVFAVFHRGAAAPGGSENLVFVRSAGIHGCGPITGNLNAPEMINNRSNTYFLTVLSGATSATRFFSVRIFYTLQVSPAPAVATFTDVPTSHPFFRFVEALAQSGITSGCGVGIFCPDAALTRGQMAVFLSRGLGLHFAP